LLYNDIVKNRDLLICTFIKIRQYLTYSLTSIASLISFSITYYYYGKIEIDPMMQKIFTIICSMLIFGIIQNFIDNKTNVIVYIFSGFLAGSFCIFALYIGSKTFYWSSLFIILFSSILYTFGGIIGLFIQTIFLKIKLIPTTNSVFISYSHKDKNITEKIKDELEKEGFHVIIRLFQVDLETTYLFVFEYHFYSL